MTTSFLKANIRLDKIHTRNQKPHYSHLNSQEKTFVKAFELVQQCEKDMGIIERQNKNWRTTEHGGNLLGIYSKAVDKKIRLSNKLNLSEIKEFALLNSCHTSRFYGGNY